MRKTKSSGLLKYDYITRYLEHFSEIDIFLQKLEDTRKQRKTRKTEYDRILIYS